MLAGELLKLLGRDPIGLDSVGIANRLAGRRMLITGAGGSIGGTLAELLASFGPAELVLLDSHEASLFHLRSRLLSRYPEVAPRFVLGDVRDQRRIAAVLAIRPPEVIFHLAAYKHVPLAEENVDQYVSVNVLGTLGLLYEAAKAGVEVVVYPSTDKAVNPPSVYGATKRIVELAAGAWAKEGTAPTVRVVRLVNVLGTQGSVVEVLSRQILAGEPLTITDAGMTRYWITMEEATLFLAQAASADQARGILSLDLGPAIRTEEIARRLANHLRPDAPVVVRYVGMRPGERLHEELRYPYEEVCASGCPGVLDLRDSPGLIGPDLLHELSVLSEDVYRLTQEELRRKVFTLARVTPLP